MYVREHGENADNTVESIKHCLSKTNTLRRLRVPHDENKREKKMYRIAASLYVNNIAAELRSASIAVYLLSPVDPVDLQRISALCLPQRCSG